MGMDRFPGGSKGLCERFVFNETISKKKKKMLVNSGMRKL